MSPCLGFSSVTSITAGPEKGRVIFTAQTRDIPAAFMLCRKPLGLFSLAGNIQWSSNKIRPFFFKKNIIMMALLIRDEFSFAVRVTLMNKSPK